MNPTPDTTASAAHSGNFSAQQAAVLLDETTWDARRKFEPTPPWSLATRAVLVLAALGAIWLSVRGQHPYTGPTSADIPILIAFIVVNFIVTVGVRRHATEGVRGKSRLRRSDIVALVLAWAAAVAGLAALAAAGVSFSHYPTTVLIIPGAVYAAIMATHANWLRFAIGIAIAVVGVVGLFAGPAGSWAVAGVGLCALFLVHAAILVWRERA